MIWHVQICLDMSEHSILCCILNIDLSLHELVEVGMYVCKSTEEGLDERKKFPYEMHFSPPSSHALTGAQRHLEEEYCTNSTFSLAFLSYDYHLLAIYMKIPCPFFLKR